MTRPTFLSLFSGIGGLDLGLERAGWECVGQVENDPYCNRVLAKHWPDVPRWGDIKEVDPDDLPRADLICGGFPCQPDSQAGKRLGRADERWVWPEMARIVRHLRPRWVLVENVPGLLARTGGMGVVLGDLASIGYDAEWDCVPADALGAPHRRERVWLVAYPDGQRQPQPPRRVGQEWGRPGNGSQPLADAHSPARRLPAPVLTGACSAPLPRAGQAEPGRGGRPDHAWAVEPDVGRVAHGVPARLDRLRGLGNAVVPQVAELVGRRILNAWQGAA